MRWKILKLKNLCTINSILFSNNLALSMSRQLSKPICNPLLLRQALSGISSNTLTPSLQSQLYSSRFSSLSQSELPNKRTTPDDVIDNVSDDPGTDGEEEECSSIHSNREVVRDLEIVFSCLTNFHVEPAEAKRLLHSCGVIPRTELVDAALQRLRHDWAAAYTFFLWAGDQPGYEHDVSSYHSMLAALGRARRFDTAWALVADMRCRGLLKPQTLLILIRRYAAIHDVARAINTFYSYKNFGFSVGIEEFQSLLGALCRYKNVEDAEHLLMCNEKTHPFETKTFNIVLNGWCNVLVRVRDAKRFWVEMDKRGIVKDVISYGCMISCYSKARNLNDVLKLYNEMKESGIEPDRKVYNAVVYALAKGKCMDNAKNLVKTMEEKGIAPNAVTFNSLIRPLCKAGKLDEAWLVFDGMRERGFVPSIRTYHSFFDVSRNADEVFDLLNRMKMRGCSPVADTYIMLIRKLSRWRQHVNVSKLWEEMKENGIGPDRSAYIVFIHGLFLNGKLEEAAKYYEEMKVKGFEPEPRTDEMIQAWFSGKAISEKAEIK